MHFFSHFYLEQNYHTLPRKQSISSAKTILYGPPKSGKTSLALDFANNSNLSHKKIIYLDCQDPRVSYEEAKSELLKLYLEKKIELLIIKNYTHSFTLPNLDQIIITSQTPIQIPSFRLQQCNYLTLIEYASFCFKNLAPDLMLKNFIKDGNLPQMPFLQEHQKTRTKQEMLQLSLSNDLNLFAQLALFQSQKLTSFQFYTLLKKHLKISKDKTYAFIQSLEEKGLIFFVPHILPNKPKKLYFADFSIPKALHLHHTILPILENMFVLELRALNQEIFYDDFGCFIIPNLGKFLFAPFAQQDFIAQKLSKMPQESIKIITLNFSDHTQGRFWEALNFLEFALGGIE
ncbi:hypothetical protein BBW65_05310 [Helicobacter enhydrae]|uniref:AAA+ ATPase domain-containing protein n=1 Tax=Helicobacter enhydrae TaxID=222136 RepID=A0A1B1U667_9HELI|nr:ATP-binding protein [Helicobacter enhydrae]ANV98248.1 hypothetical protein BBW65_05310 [Helicobacter enhydrae]